MDSAVADSLALARQDSRNRARPGYIVDSILPVGEQLRRFRSGTLEAPTRFLGSAQGRDALVRRFMQSLEATDTAALARLTISRAEFAYLVYPESPYAARPYQQSPDLVWLRHSAASATGLSRLLQRVGGRRLVLLGMTCRPEPVHEGSNQIWRDCVVRFTSGSGDTTSLQLFSAIVEREGQFKILSYANAF
jgi:hypothetical protein